VSAQVHVTAFATAAALNVDDVNELSGDAPKRDARPAKALLEKLGVELPAHFGQEDVSA
jgi:hypothetical protein